MGQVIETGRRRRRQRAMQMRFGTPLLCTMRASPSASIRVGLAMLVAIGAGSDVLGPDPGMIDSERSAEIVAAFPRLMFKNEFTALLADHCRRKPLSQRGTWLEGLCRRESPAVWTDRLEDDIATASFPE